MMEQLKQLSRGAVEIFTQAELAQRLTEATQAGRQMRIKLGLDPTSPDIHLGHTVVLRKMRQFQDLGHKAVLIIGDYTARIGDPTGQNTTRPMLTPEQIERNAKTYFEQAGKILDTDPARLEVRHNSEWLADLRLADTIRLAATMTVARMLERDTFDIRYKRGDPIGVHEFLYPLMQGYDSVMVRSDVELGGTDQTFNNLVGRDLQRQASQPPQIVITTPILVGLDGKEKMSKSKGNYVGVTDAPGDMFGKIMSISDAPDLSARRADCRTDRPEQNASEAGQSPARQDDRRPIPRLSRRGSRRRRVRQGLRPGSTARGHGGVRRARGADSREEPPDRLQSGRHQRRGQAHGPARRRQHRRSESHRRQCRDFAPRRYGRPSRQTPLCPRAGEIVRTRLDLPISCRP
jgi:tyrosyl-tRNA synthetase